MSAMVCQAPKKMKTPYFMVHIIIKNTCAITLSATLLHCLSHVCSRLACIDLSTSPDIDCSGSAHLGHNGSGDELCEHSDGLTR